MLSETLIARNDVSVNFTGTRLKFANNAASIIIFIYNNIRATTLGPELLGTLFSRETIDRLKVHETFDYYMHYLVCPFVMLILASYHDQMSSISTGKSTVVWVCCILIISLHYIHMFGMIFLILLPMRRAFDVALMVPTNGYQAFDGCTNTFINFTSVESIGYAVNDDQSNVIVLALQRESKVTAMVYNRAWIKKFSSFSSYLICYSHLLALLLYIFTFNESFILIGYLIIFVVYWLCVCPCQLEYHFFLIVECVLSIISTPFLSCFYFYFVMSSHDMIGKLKERIESDNLHSAKNLRPLHCSCNCYV